ncbi:MAG: hypothetical protein ACT4RN_01755 [Pseudonocardia sp.]
MDRDVVRPSGAWDFEAAALELRMKIVRVQWAASLSEDLDCLPVHTLPRALNSRRSASPLTTRHVVAE